MTNRSNPWVFNLRGWNTRHFVEKLVYYKLSFFTYSRFFLSKKNENCAKCEYFKKKSLINSQHFDFQKDEKKVYVYTLRNAEYNGIIYFVQSVNLRKEIGLPQTQLNALFYMQIVFFAFLRISLEPNFQWQNTLVIFCFAHFSHKWIIKKFFFNLYDPLKQPTELTDSYLLCHNILWFLWSVVARQPAAQQKLTDCAILRLCWKTSENAHDFFIPYRILE